MVGGSRHLPTRGRHIRIILEITHMNDRAVEDGLGDHTHPARRGGIMTLEHFARPGSGGVVMGAQVDEATVEPIDECRHTPTQLHDTLDNRIEDGLQLEI